MIGKQRAQGGKRLLSDHEARWCHGWDSHPGSLSWPWGPSVGLWHGQQRKRLARGPGHKGLLNSAPMVGPGSSPAWDQLLQHWSHFWRASIPKDPLPILSHELNDAKRNNLISTFTSLKRLLLEALRQLAFTQSGDGLGLVDKLFSWDGIQVMLRDGLAWSLLGL